MREIESNDYVLREMDLMASIKELYGHIADTTRKWEIDGINKGLYGHIADTLRKWEMSMKLEGREVRKPVESNGYVIWEMDLMASIKSYMVI